VGDNTTVTHTRGPHSNKESERETERELKPIDRSIFVSVLSLNMLQLL
jgi:hypothetical protein